MVKRDRTMDQRECIIVECKKAKLVKNALEGLSLIDKTVQVAGKIEGKVAFVVVKDKTEEAVKACMEWGSEVAVLDVNTPGGKHKNDIPKDLKESDVVQTPSEKNIAGDDFHGCTEVETITLDPDATKAQTQLARVISKGVPVLITNLPIGRCVDWTADDLAKIDRTVNAQVCTGVKVDLAGHRAKNTKGNFTFHPMKFSELIERCSDPGKLPFLKCEGERYYLRSVGDGKMVKPSDLKEDIPELGGDVDMEAVGRLMEKSGCRFHSSALRVTAPDTELWAHYDTHPNYLTQLIGEKSVILFPPSSDRFLYVEGTSSRTDSLTHPDPHHYPLTRFALPLAKTITLPSRCTLYIPPLWFHHTHSKEGLSVAVNAFFEDTSLKDWYHPKDLYGNKDFPAGMKLVEKGVRAVNEISSMPQPYKAFYGRRLCDAVENLTGCTDMTVTRYIGTKKVAVVTGGTGVIGREIVKGLAEKGFHVVVPCRRIEAEVEGGVVRVCDLADPESIRRCVENLKAEFGEIELLVNNAGVVSKQRVETKDGLELQFSVNVLSYYKFIKGLLPCGLKNVVNVCSNWAGGFDPADPNFASKKYSPTAAYRASKQADRILTRALAPLIHPCVINGCHPGVVATPLAGQLGLQHGTHTPKEAAAAPLHLASLPPPPYTGKYLADGPSSSPTDDAEWNHLEKKLLDILEWC
eukprot:TRINITY_DN4535_c0_g1_i2.p1 TRINITY_DN4535_c0_g1~~TRINITY_DN4535_c0_g1_i2.p1  ORF type:complete len:692 (+),score=146.90 TRINITY_DN4535_c0_g1_i2:117-2192(+)